MKGFFNRLLRIDLTTQESHYEEISDDILVNTLGGKGLASYYLFKENPVGVDPFSAESIVIICVGPATGTRTWGQSRYGVFAKSPATGGWGESYCGGSLAPKIKGCGIDAIIIKGESPALIFLKIDETGVAFEDATAIQGSETVEAERYLLRDSHPEAGAMVIGPAGEKRVRFACIKSDRWRSVGRGGMGAIFGAKRLKGISFSGRKKAEIADPELFKEVNKIVAKKGKASPAPALFRAMGTPMMVDPLNAHNTFPTEYWKAGQCPDVKTLNGDYMLENFDVKADSCPTCFLRCSKRTRVLKGRHKGLMIEGPEYETIFALGALNKIETLEEVVYLNDICDRLGIDTISAGNMAAFAVEAHKRGKTTFEIEYNQPERIRELFELIAQDRGLGKILGKGIIAASRLLDLEDIAIHVKGLEPAGYDPRSLKGMGLSYATSARGACHLRGTFYKAEISGQIPKDQIEGKAELQIDYEDRSAIFDCLILCRFFRDLTLWDELAMYIKSITGLDFSKTHLQCLANDVTQRTRAYNTREGVGPDTDTLPKRFLKESTREGESISLEQLQTMINEYNQIRRDREKQWDSLRIVPPKSDKERISA